MHTRKSIDERFHEKYEIVEPGGCWVWMGSINSNGYGGIRAASLTDGGRSDIGAHRLSWMIHHGPIPPGICILHKCDNPPCVNPEHLWLGTYADNTADRVAKGRSGSASGESNGRAKLTDDQVAEIRVIGRSMFQREIGKLFDVDQSLISLILNNKRWSTP